ncbi:structural cement protein Gp24 [Castellaniella sp. UC4442_H9]
MPITGGYTINHGDRYAGMVVDSELSNSVSKLNKTGATIPWGLFVARDGDGAIKPVTDTTTAANIVGVLRRELNRAQQDGDASGAPDGRDATVLTVGTIYVQTLGAVAAGDPVYAVIGTSGAPAVNPGIANNAAGTTATTGVQITGARFKETTTAAGLAAISLAIGG